MKIRYDKETDSLYIELVERPSVDSRELAAGLVADFDDKGRVIGLDIEHASRMLDLTKLETESMPSVQRRVA